MDIKYSLKRSKKRKKTISLQIGSHSDITVYAPYFTPVAEISRFVEEKRNWIERTLRNQSRQMSVLKEKTYETGEEFYYLGRPYPLKAGFDPLENTGVLFRLDRFMLNCPDNGEMKKYYFTLWYQKKAKEHIPARVAHFSRELNLWPRGVRITSARSRWGSCSQDNSLAFSFRLIMAPPQVIDYVVVHELMHMRQKNHSSKFWRLVIEAMPDFTEHRRWLRKHQEMLKF
ncbi:MAG: SprT family zinc-dependent metalloprotease [Smithellaceae bacterium]|jgi:predicted metal-dependent hydrolase|nr:SprT family zinc-dependent metalloprotease [Smithellaceae bacterium]